METSREGIIIADTSGLVSLFLPHDHNHAVALKAARQLQSARKDILIPATVLVEFLNIGVCAAGVQIVTLRGGGYRKRTMLGRGSCALNMMIL